MRSVENEGEERRWVQGSQQPKPTQNLLSLTYPILGNIMSRCSTEPDLHNYSKLALSLLFEWFNLAPSYHSKPYSKFFSHVLPTKKIFVFYDCSNISWTQGIDKPTNRSNKNTLHPTQETWNENQNS